MSIDRVKMVLSSMCPCIFSSFNMKRRDDFVAFVNISESNTDREAEDFAGTIGKSA